MGKGRAGTGAGRPPSGGPHRADTSGGPLTLALTPGAGAPLSSAGPGGAACPQHGTDWAPKAGEEGPV